MNVLTTRQDLLQQLRQIKQTVRQELEPLSETQMQWKPAPDQWGVLECLSHLNMVSQYYVSQLKFKLEHTPPNAHVSTDFEMSVNGRMMLGLIDPKSPRKIPTPGMFKPKPYHLDTPKVLARYMNILDDLESFLEKADQIDWHLKVFSPFTNWLKFRIGDVLMFVIAHHQRHLNQAKRVMQQPGFPIA